jgi:hypothetical protein
VGRGTRHHGLPSAALRLLRACCRLHNWQSPVVDQQARVTFARGQEHTQWAVAVHRSGFCWCRPVEVWFVWCERIRLHLSLVLQVAQFTASALA